MINQMEFPDIFSKPLTAIFSEKNTSSDGGLIFMKQINDALQITKSISDAIHDQRDENHIKHELENMIHQRLYQVTAGYEDVNDSDYLKNDPVFKLLCGKSDSKKKEFDALASTPTICRLENSVTIKELHQMAENMIHFYLKRNRKRFKKQKKLQITIDLDPTNITTYGNQQLSLFNGYYGETCYLPLIIADGDNGDIITSILKPGTKHATFLLIPIVKRLFAVIEEKYPNVKFVIRADSGFQNANLFKYFEDKKKVIYRIALISNENLIKALKEETKKAECLYAERKETVRVFGELGYKAESWNKFRRVIYRIEVNSHQTDVRFVVTNDFETTPEEIKKDYNKRSDTENIIKEFKVQSFGERLSCETFQANFFRLIISLSSLILFQELKKKLCKTELAKSYVSTIREKILKIAATVKITCRKIWFYLPKSYPYQDIWAKALCRT